jgi:hypothetical protein
MGEPELDSDLLDLLGEAARSNEICPTISRLAHELQVGVVDIQLALDRLRRSQLIYWTLHYLGRDHGRVRVLTLLPGGEQTRLPETGKRRRRRRDKELEHAKTVLRRRGCVVFDAEIRDGRKGRGLVRVDHRRLKRGAVLALAELPTDGRKCV